MAHYIFIALIAIVAALMVWYPESVVRKEYQSDPVRLQHIKHIGIIFLVLCGLSAILAMLVDFILL
jgi:amino acid permease